MPLTITRRIAYELGAQMLLLLLAAGSAALLTALKFLPRDPLATSLPYTQVSAAAHIWESLALLSGLLAGGLLLVASRHPDGRVPQEGALRRLHQGWTLLLLLASAAACLGQIEGRQRLELPLLLDVIVLALLVGWLLVIANGFSQRRAAGGRAWDAIAQVWLVGMVIVALALGIGLIPAVDYWQDRVLRVLAVSGSVWVGMPLAALALIFWLMQRFSTVPESWIQASVLHLGGMLAVAGTLVTGGQLAHLPGALPITGGLAALIVLGSYTLLAAHSYRALANLQPVHTLAAHWVGLAVVLWFGGMGVLGAALLLPGFGSAAQGTRLTDLQLMLAASGVIAVLLGLLNQMTAELRGSNARITGLLPFWLLAAGWIGGGAALLAAGIVQVYLERLLGLGYLDTQTALLPLVALWIGGGLIGLPGLALYALHFRARPVQRP